MTTSCQACLGEAPDAGDYHARCARELLGTSHVPVIDVELVRLHTLALAMVGKVSLSGIQRKISLGHDAGRATLRVAAERGLLILKPQTETWPHLPENEHVTMRMASLVDIDVPPCALVALEDGSRAFLVRRFDRDRDGRKLRQEDFCQLAEMSPREKYEGSAELCGKLVLRYATEPLVELLRLFRLLLFAWWTGNGDMHLKNFSLLTGADGRHRLAPAYDQLSTLLVIPKDPLALPVCGKKDRLTRKTWLAFAAAAGLPERAAQRAITTQQAALEEARALIGRSALPPAMQDVYRALLTKRSAALA